MRSNYLHRGRHICALLAILYLFIVRFPGPYIAYGIGLDHSWYYGINYFAHSHYIFGRDVAFTYGPMGYLLVPEDMGSNFIEALSFRLALHILLVIILLFYALKQKKVLPVGLFVLFYTLASIVGILSYDEYSFLTIICLLVCVSWEKTRLARIAEIINPVLAGTFLFIKFNLGISSLAVILISVLVRLLIRDKGALRSLFIFAGTYLFTVLLLSEINLGSIRNLLAWLGVSIAMADGYSVAMSTVGSRISLAFALLGAGVYLILSLALFKIRSKLFYFALAFGIAVFFSFKHGYVRQDVHELIFFPFLLTAISILILSSKAFPELKLCLISFLIVFILAIPVAITDGYLDYSLVAQSLGLSGWSNIHRLLDLKSARRELVSAGHANLKSDQLPPDWLALIKGNGARVGTLPWEISYCAANDLVCDPFPTLQMYNAHKASLDKWAAAHYRGSQAPEFILAEFADIDGRNMLLSTPATWRAILHHFEIAEMASPQGLHLLRRRSQASEENLTVINQEAANVGQWISVPSSDKALFASIDMRLRMMGLINKAFFRVPPVMITLFYESGRVSGYRIVPDTAKNGLLINYVAKDMVGLDGLFTHNASDRVTKFMISGAGSDYYEKNIKVVWEEDANYEITYNKRNPLSLELAGPQTLFALDSINGVLITNSQPIRIDSTTEDMIVINGWAVDERAKQTAGGVFISIDGNSDVPATYGQNRPDVAAALKNDNYEFSGFSAAIPTASLEKGIHTFSVKIITAAKTEYYEPAQRVLVDVR
jgi:hypothetical protein